MLLQRTLQAMRQSSLQVRHFSRTPLRKGDAANAPGEDPSHMDILKAEAQVLQLAEKSAILESKFDGSLEQNMPFQTKNKTRLLCVMVAYLGTGFAIPFIAVRFQMHKKANA